MNDKLPSKSEFKKLNFTKVCTIKPHLEWVEILDSKQAEFAYRAGNTPVHIYFDAEAKWNKGRSAPHRWFMLAATTADGVKGEVVMAAPGPGQRLRSKRTSCRPLHVVGFGNANAYPKWAKEIAALSRTVDIKMPPNFDGKMLQTRAEKVVDLLNTYGIASFGDRWLSKTTGKRGDDAINRAYHARVTISRGHDEGLEDAVAGMAVSNIVEYAEAEFGDRWQPEEADKALGTERAKELRKLLDWAKAEKSDELRMGFG